VSNFDQAAAFMGLSLLISWSARFEAISRFARVISKCTFN